MTNEEAIKILYVFTHVEDCDDAQVIEAVNVAIKALEGNTCDEREKGNCPFYTARGDV